MPETATLHASCALVDEDGVLVLGPPGAGKSSLCTALVAASLARGRFARLVSDDRTRVTERHGRLVARGVNATAGLIETRGLGIHAVPHEPAALVRLVVELVQVDTPRMPAERQSVTLCGVELPRYVFRQDPLLAETVLTGLRLIRSADRDTLRAL